MRRILVIPLLFSVCLALNSAAKEISAPDSSFIVDFPAGWKAVPSADPAVVLKLVHAKAFVEFSRQTAKMDDNELQASAQEMIDSLKAKSIYVRDEIRRTPIQGHRQAYYTAYEFGGFDIYAAFLNHDGISYSISARDLSEKEFRGILRSVRKPGEKVEPLAVAKKKVVFEKEPAVGDDEERSIVAMAAPSSRSEYVLEVDTSAFVKPRKAAAVVEAESVPRKHGSGKKGAEYSGAAAKDVTADAPPRSSARPVVALCTLCLLFVMWFPATIWVKKQAAKIEDVKLPPPPKNLPPDYYFPFMITYKANSSEMHYNVVARNRQLLLADYDLMPGTLIAGAVYGLASFYLIWGALTVTGRGALVPEFLSIFPAGNFLSSFPEMLFLIPLAIGAFMLLRGRSVLYVYDAQSNMMMQVLRNSSYCVIRDSHGQDLSKLIRKGGFISREWDFVDSDSHVMFSIKDDCPKMYLFRRIFGNLGGLLRSRYAVFAHDRRAGFIAPDPAFPDRYMLHLDYEFSPLARPAQLLAGSLYILSREKDYIYPWFY